MRARVTVVGAGDVGATTAQRLAERDYADVLLLDARLELTRREALDIDQAASLAGYEPRVTGTAEVTDITGSDVVVLALEAHAGDLGAPREALAQYSEQIALRCPGAIVVNATSPVEALCHLILARTGFPRQRVIGAGAILDTARLRFLLAGELDVSVRDVSTMVLGAHDQDVIPVLTLTTVGGLPIARLLSAERLETVLEALRAGHGLSSPAAARRLAAAAITEIVDAIVLDRRRLLACGALCQGEYGLSDVVLGVPVRVGKEGIHEIVELGLGDGELEAMGVAARAVRARAEAVGAP